MLWLARAELESMLGDGTLDREGLADLAEARWRTGDLPGAGEAARTHLDAGGQELIALVVAAEAFAAQGYITDSRRLAARVVERAGPDLPRLLAGEGQGGLWPPGATGLQRTTPDAAPSPTTSSPAPSSPVPAAAASSPSPAPSASGPRTTEQALEIGRTAGREIEGIEAAIGRQELAAVAQRLGLLLRMDRSLAPVILSLADRALGAGAQPADGAALHLVRGDAYRALGREAEASAAFAASSRALAARPASEETA